MNFNRCDIYIYIYIYIYVLFVSPELCSESDYVITHSVCSMYVSQIYKGDPEPAPFLSWPGAQISVLGSNRGSSAWSGAYAGLKLGQVMPVILMGNLCV